MLPPSPPEQDCPRCLTTAGKLCSRCERQVLPQLAVNVGWLKLMGEPRTEQTRRQVAKVVPVSAEQAAHLERKRAARRPHRRGYRSLAAAILAA